MKLKPTHMLPCACLLSPAPLYAGDLTVEINGVRSDAGRAYVAVHRQAPGIEFPDATGSVAGFNLAARRGTLAVVLKNLPEGGYAVVAYHDENGNGELDRNVLGIPTEGHAFSNDATGFMGPPPFSEASVSVGAEPVTASATMAY